MVRGVHNCLYTLLHLMNDYAIGILGQWSCPLGKGPLKACYEERSCLHACGNAGFESGVLSNVTQAFDTGVLLIMVVSCSSCSETLRHNN